MYDLIDAPLLLKDLIGDMLLVTVPTGHYIVPASLHSLLIVVLSGGVKVCLADGERFIPQFALSGPQLSPHVSDALPNTRLLIVPIRSGRLLSLLGVSESEVFGRLLALDTILPRHSFDKLSNDFVDAKRLSAKATIIYDLLSSVFISYASRLDKYSLLCVPPELCTLPIENLATSFGLGVRQFERKFLHSYGRSLRSYRRQLRVSRWVHHLAEQFCHLSDKSVGMLFDDDFFDQAHLCRESKQLLGFTPGEVIAGMQGNNSKSWILQLPTHRFSDVFGSFGY